MSWCSDAPEDEAICLFAGLLANPGVYNSLKICLILFKGSQKSMVDISLLEVDTLMCRSICRPSMLVSMQFYPNYLITLTCHLAPEGRWFSHNILASRMYLHSYKDYTSASFLCQYCLPWTLLQEAFPLKHFWNWTVASLARLFFHSVFKFFISHRPSLFITKQGVLAFAFNFWSFFLTQKSAWNTILNTEEGRVNGLDYAPNAMDSPTFSSTSHSACFGDLHASTSSHIVMSVHHDVYTGGGLLHFASYAGFSSTDIHVCPPSHRHHFPHAIFFI